MKPFVSLERLVTPTSVAIVGASDNPLSVGGRLVANVVDHSEVPGEVYFVNARRSEVRGQATYSSVADLPEAPDVAVIALAAENIPAVLEQCAARGIPFAVVLSSGFSETGAAGKALEEQIAEIVHRTGLHVYGPNCPGISNVARRIGLNFSPAFAHDLTPGVIGLATQGGGLGRAVLQAMDRGLGVAEWLSGGNEVDLDIADFIYHLAESPDVSVIATIIEGIKDGPRFVEAALHARRMSKPIIAIKLGKSEQGTKAALSHTTSMTGDAAVNSAAFAQLGIVEVDDLDELIDTAALFARRLPRAEEPVAIYSYSGGTAALAADMLGTTSLRLAELSDVTVKALQEALPRFGTHSNPVDTGTEVLSDADLIRATMEPVLVDPQVGATLIPVPIEMGDTTTKLAQVAVALRDQTGAVVVPVWITDRMGDGYRALADGGLVPARSLRNAIAAVRRWAEYGAAMASESRWQPAAEISVPWSGGEATTRVVLHERAAKERLAEAGLVSPASTVCGSAGEAAAAVDAIDGPAVLKIVSADITHKTDVGGVLLGVVGAEAGRAAYDQILRAVAERAPQARIDGVLVEEMVGGDGFEMLVGVHRDATFGHVMTFGSGGTLVEVLGDHARHVLPLSRPEAEALIACTKVRLLTSGLRGRSATPTDRVVDALVAISDFVMTHRDHLEELEINPLWLEASGERVLALDALIVERENARP